jgi:hypothetical protein
MLSQPLDRIEGDSLIPNAIRFGKSNGKSNAEFSRTHGMDGLQYIAGYTDENGEFINVEKGGDPPSDYDLEVAERIIVHYVDEDMNDVYFTVLGGLDANFDIYDAIDDKVDSDNDRYAPAYPGS